MTPQKRMSPLTALFLGIFGVGAVGLASGTALALYGLHMVDGNANALIHFAGDTIKSLPEVIDALPPAVGDLLNDRRAPEYASRVGVDVAFTPSTRAGQYVPVLTVSNRGDEVVSLLAVRVAALDVDGVARREWTEVVATPLAIDDDWRGPLLPGSKRHVVLSSWRGVSAASATAIRGDVEISDVRVWRGSDGKLSVASATGN